MFLNLIVFLLCSLSAIVSYKRNDIDFVIVNSILALLNIIYFIYKKRRIKCHTKDQN